MQANVGVADRLARAALSLAIVAIAARKPGRWAVPAAFLAGDIMGSAVSGYCPLYRILGISTAGTGNE